MPIEEHYIAVDKDQVMRCKWCGTSESEHWTKGSEGKGPYCSQTCADADNYDSSLGATILFPVLWIIMVVGAIFFSPGFTLPSDISVVAMVLGITFIIFVCCPLTCSLSQLSYAREARKKVAKGSRRSDKTFGMMGLKCRNCGGPLEAKDGAHLVECQYCGIQNKLSID
ncbi:hypothetical protein E4H12_13685 [Candidatus Thorarchaeota archaeon]|nr:MAG: hypothetical protein E4H12_13685 [Candidatus Thorarchaeota archaeon]